MVDNYLGINNNPSWFNSFTKEPHWYNKFLISNISQQDFNNIVKRTPGISSALNNYLRGSGSDRIKELVRKRTGDKWYGGIAESLADTEFGRDYVINQALEETLPRINGSTATARWFLEHGGKV